MRGSDDGKRNARLLLAEPSGGAGPPQHVRGFSVPPRPVRFAQRVAVKLGVMDWERVWLRPLAANRRSVLGAAAVGPPRLLVRVDEFPYYSAFDRPEHGNAASRRFNAVMADAGVYHLIGINAQLTHNALDPGADGGRPLGTDEVAVIEEMRASGLVTFAQHGTTHRTRFGNPRRDSEYCGLSPSQLAVVLDRGREALSSVGIEARVIVAPFNRFDATQWTVISERFDVICGGPESIALMGLHGGPLWHGEAVYLPCYAPLYARASEVLPALERIIELAPGTWIPIALHSMWELDDDFSALKRLAERMAAYAAPWTEFLDVVDRSRKGSVA